MQKIKRLTSITEFHRTRQLPPPEHPLISVVNYADVQILPEFIDSKWIFEFYLITLKKNIEGKILYGQQSYDFDEGVMFFIAPGQVFGVEKLKGISSAKKAGWMLLVHPEFLWNTPLYKGIKKYGFFDYAINEALFVAPKEENSLIGIVHNIQREYHANIDKFTQSIIASQIETLLNYADRFYERQFLTRKRAGHQILDKLEQLCTAYFQNPELMTKGLPTVKYFSDLLNVSPKYLSNMLKSLTGQTVQQLIHERLIEKAKERLSSRELSISEIAYELGFEHPQSFSKMFKLKTALSPIAFRKSIGLN